ncbi:helix-turn-helix domain-containing protein [Morganella morganii]
MLKHDNTVTESVDSVPVTDKEQDDNAFYLSVIKDIILWIEHNLDKSLQLDVVAERSGYTKWYFQRIFKRFTDMTLAGYIRRRRLTKAATELRLTTQNIGDIALKYQFDSQQSFARRFKAVFNMTPTEYRRNPNWDLTTLQPPVQLEMPPLPQPDIIMLDDIPVMEKGYHYQSPLDEIGHLHEEIRSTFWRDFIRLVSPDLPYCYVRTAYDSTADKPESIAIGYHIGVDDPAFIVQENELTPAVINCGKYAKFHFDGLFRDYRDFTFNVYLYALPQLGLCRRPGLDIEKYTRTEAITDNPPEHLCVNYYIPVL